ncbi:MAG: zinc-dependent metalloprotease [Gemmatimonadota bacterium]|nr:zinc-dependent metalloprotease [Gemmatimonadota bacterium]
MKRGIGGRFVRGGGALTALLVLTACAGGGGATSPTAPRPQPARNGAAGPRPYAEVVTPAMRSDSGLFTVHTEGPRVLFEIPDSLFDRDMLLVSRIAGTPPDLSPFINAGSKVAEQVVRWERRSDRVLLRKLSFGNVAEDSLPIAQSVRMNNLPVVLGSFPIQALGSDPGSVVVDVSDFYRGDVRALSGLSRQQRQQWSVRRLDPDRTFLEYARAFPLNVDVRATMTFDADQPPSEAATGSLTLQMHHSMVLLPAEPMRVRYADPRVGWFTIEQVNFGLDEQKAATQEILRRWRLEPSDPEAYARGEPVEPVKPIVYYLDPATPEKWRPYVRQGIEDWQAAFEAAGFRNAIRAADPPSPEEDPDWSPEDVRYSVVRWVANLTRNAVGPSVSDPRSGEIIESDVIWYHNHMRSYRNRLLIETGASNPEARSLRIADATIGETMRQVIAHEVGHAIGLPHNMIASSSFAVDSLRSPSFTDRYGVAPSIMDYARQNYIAQPGDGVRRFIRKIGPYDHYAVEFGYRVFPSAPTPEAEKAILDRMIEAHAGDPVYRFGSADGVNPWAQTEDMGDDPVRASTLAIENLKRVAPRLVEWTRTDGEGYEDLEELYGELVGQWRRYVGHVVTLVGGVWFEPRTADQPGAPYRPVTRERQRAAVQFLSDQVFTTPRWLVDPDLLRRIEEGGAMERLRAIQAGVLDQLLDPARLERVMEARAFANTAYAPAELMADVRGAVWTELRERRAIDPWRRSLQRAHVERLAWLLEGAPVESNGGGGGFQRRRALDVEQSDLPALARAELTEIARQARLYRGTVEDVPTRLHLDDIVARVERVLEGD